MHKIAFFAPPYKASEAAYALYLKALTQKDFLAEFHRKYASFTRKRAN